MTEIEKKNQEQNLNAESYDDEDDLWDMQSTEKSNPKQIDLIDEDKKIEELKSESIKDDHPKLVQEKTDIEEKTT